MRSCIQQVHNYQRCTDSQQTCMQDSSTLARFFLQNLL